MIVPNLLLRNRRVTLVIAVAALSAGCGVAEYEKRLAKRVDEVRKSAIFDVLYQATELPDTPILVRIPLAFTQRLVEGAELDGKRIDAQRAKVPGLELPSSLVSYEANVQDSSGGKQPYYIYLAALPAAKAEPLRSATRRKFDGAKLAEPGPANEPVRLDQTGELFQRVCNAFAQTNAAWQEETCPTPTGATVVWQRLTVAAEQEFYYTNSYGESRYVKLPGRLEVWARYVADHLVLIVWRVPQSLLPASQQGTLAPLVAGSVASR